jgi:hypothetical protein
VLVFEPAVQAQPVTPELALEQPQLLHNR